MYELQVIKTGGTGDWKKYATYFTLEEALRTFHRLETHEFVTNVRILKDEQETGIVAR